MSKASRLRTRPDPPVSHQNLNCRTYETGGSRGSDLGGQISVEISWADFFPLAAGEQERLQRRLDRLRKLGAEADKAALAFRQIRTPEELRIRPHFAVRFEAEGVPGDASDRLLPPRRERPPATRLVSPRGIALRVFLTALFVSQTRSAGERPGNTLPVADRSNTDVPLEGVIR